MFCPEINVCLYTPPANDDSADLSSRVLSGHAVTRGGGAEERAGQPEGWEYLRRGERIWSDVLRTLVGVIGVRLDSVKCQMQR